MSKLYKLNLQLFANANPQGTTTEALSVENKTFYSDYLIDNAMPKLVHGQFGQKHPIPQNGGKTIEFRKFSPLGKLLTPLTEGVTPDGQSLSVSKIEATVDQYGGYVTYTDVIDLTAIDDVVVQATKLLGNQAGMTVDTIDREVLNGGTNVVYAGGAASRTAVTANLKVDDIKKAVRALKTQNADKIGDSFVAIIHPDVTYDLTNDPTWQSVKDYDPKDWYEGEIGKIAGVRFVETTEAKIFHGADLASNSRSLLVNGAVSASTSVTFDGGTVAAGALVGRKVLIGDVTAKVTANTTTTLTLDTAVTAADNAVIYPGEGGKEGQAIYSTLILGDNAYGITEIEGGGMEHIVKAKGSSGVADALNQRGSIGWKTMHVCERLVEQFMVRIESASTFSGEVTAN